MKKPILNIENLSKSFDGLKLFDKVNISIQESTINSLFGSNGSGKTTFFNMIGGYENSDSGKITFNGMTIKFNNEYVIAKSGMGKMWQEPTIFPNHNVMQNLLVSDKSHPGEYILNYLIRPNSIRKNEEKLKEKAYEILRKFKLSGKENQVAGSLSLGERKLVSISMLLMNDAKLLLLDEPFSAVNRETIKRMSEAMIMLKQSGRTVFIIEHKIKFAEAISDNCFMIDRYKIEKRN